MRAPLWLWGAPVTRTVRGIPTELPLDTDDGMPELCAAILDNVRPVRRSLPMERTTALLGLRGGRVRRAVDC